MNALIAWLERTHAGDLASVAGLLVALIGFAITIWNVRASRAAALRAEQAALDARRAISLIDSVTELSTAIAALEEIKRLHREGGWTLLPDRYAALCKVLNKVRHELELSDDQESRIQGAIGYLAELEWMVESRLGSDRRPQIVAEWNRRMSRHIMALDTLLLELKKRAGTK